MTSRLRRLSLLSCAAALLATPSAAHAEDPQEIAQQIIVKHAADSTAGEQALVRRAADVSLDYRIARLDDTEVVHVDEGSRSAALAELNADPQVEWAEPNRVTRTATNDNYWRFQWSLFNDGSSSGSVNDADSDFPEAWVRNKGAGVTVAVVDSGVQANHPDLLGQTVVGKSFLQGLSAEADDHGHGTHVAGIIAAKPDNSIGITGASPDARVMSLRVFDASGNGSTANTAAAFAYAGSQGVRIVNASLAAAEPTAVERQAIEQYPNTLYVVAAGNDGVNVDTGSRKTYPCMYPSANVICVGSSDKADALSSFSNHGANSVDLMAPGTAIISTYKGSAYAYMDGTSMASPLVASAAALVLSQKPSLSAIQIKSVLMDTADHPAGLAGRSLTGGRLNAAAAVESVSSTPGPVIPAPPAAPANLSASSNPESITLKWTDSPEIAVTGYNVYSQSMLTGTWNLLQTVDSNQTTITGLTGGSLYTYRVTAVDSYSQESPPSNTVTAQAGKTSPGGGGTTPAPSDPTPTPTPEPTPTPTPVPPVTPSPKPYVPPVVVVPPTTPAPKSPGDMGVPGEPKTPIVESPAVITALAKTTKAGKTSALRMSISKAAAVQVTVAKRSGSRYRVVATKSVTYKAGRQTISLKKGIAGQRLTKGLWKITFTLNGKARSLTVRA